MAQVAAVYTIAPFIRRPEDVAADLGSVRLVPDKPSGPALSTSGVWACVKKDPAEVIDQMFQEALARDPLKKKAWVVLVDGNPVQLALVKKTAKKYGVHVTIVVDLIHVLEYVWKATFRPAGQERPRHRALGHRASARDTARSLERRGCGDAPERHPEASAHEGENRGGRLCRLPAQVQAPTCATTGASRLAGPSQRNRPTADVVTAGRSRDTQVA
jgi:hypothetical protein